MGEIPKCNRCKKTPKMPNDGLPAIVTFELTDGRKMSICHDCMNMLCKLNKSEARAFINAIEI